MIGNKEEAYECFNLALKYMENGNYFHAKKLFLKAKRMFPDIKINDNLKICEEEIKKTENIGTEKVTYNNDTCRENQNKLHERHKKKNDLLDKILKTNNYYEILGLSKNCNDDDIKSAYKKLAKLYHPDKNKEKGAEEAFKKVSKAFQHLINKEKRNEYGNASEEDLQQNYRTYYYHDDSFTSEDLFRNFFGINFATCNNRTFRSNINSNRSYTTSNNNNNSSNNNQRNYSFVQVLIFLIMFIIFFLSSHFEQPKAIYSLQKTNYFNTTNYTTLNKVRFYTKGTFNYNYPKNSDSRLQIEYEVEYKYYEHECIILSKKIKSDYYREKTQYNKKLNYQEIPESCIKLKTLEAQYNNYIFNLKRR